MLRGFLLFVFAAAAVGNPTVKLPNLNPYSPNGRIVGGKLTSIEETPYQVSLQVNGFGFCGGTIISDQWVLTAGHCVEYRMDWITIRAGSSKQSSGGSLHKVHSIVRHENYRTNSYGIPENDIAVIRVKEKFKLDKTRQPIRMFNADEVAVAGSMSTITGWGTTTEGGSTSDHLRTVDVPVISTDDCNAAYTFLGGIPKGQLCAAYPEGGKDTCQGDSGGPMTIDNELAGIVSWGNGCARPNYPGVYTAVSYFRKWIASKTGI